MAMSALVEIGRYDGTRTSRTTGGIERPLHQTVTNRCISTDRAARRGHRFVDHGCLSADATAFERILRAADGRINAVRPSSRDLAAATPLRRTRRDHEA
jgi:hypothetical protein